MRSYCNFETKVNNRRNLLLLIGAEIDFKKAQEYEEYSSICEERSLKLMGEERLPGTESNHLEMKLQGKIKGGGKETRRN